MLLTFLGSQVGDKQLDIATREGDGIWTYNGLSPVQSLMNIPNSKRRPNKTKTD